MEIERSLEMKTDRPIDRTVRSNRPDRHLDIIKLGLVDFHTAWELQKKLQRNLIGGAGVDSIVLCQHYPVITRGRTSKSNSIKVSPTYLSRHNVELYSIERGGDVTFHGPGQLVAYPILDLRRSRTDVHWYMRSLEEVIVNTLKFFGVYAFQVAGKTGVWTYSNSEANNSRLRPEGKIASIGVRISRWCTMHGLALNVLDCSFGFSLINPCGYEDINVTSLEQLGSSTDLLSVERVFETQFKKVFGYA